jgi:hypothetical protein
MLSHCLRPLIASRERSNLLHYLAQVAAVHVPVIHHSSPPLSDSRYVRPERVFVSRNACFCNSVFKPSSRAFRKSDFRICEADVLTRRATGRPVGSAQARYKDVL